MCNLLESVICYSDFDRRRRHKKKKKIPTCDLLAVVGLYL